ncbi:MAG: hypothetical protein VKJ02_07885 [Snowella sp.]|nr:hypothetical protein [Snowella sp.]
MTFWEKLWGQLNTNITINWTETVPDELKTHPNFAAAVALSRAYRFIEENQLEDALIASEEALSIAPTLEIDFGFWYRLCY